MKTDTHLHDETDLADWISGRSVWGMPAPVDTYHPGPTTWGADPRRSRAIMARREAKRDAANCALLASNMDDFNFTFAAWYHAARELISHGYPDAGRIALERSGYVLFRKDDRRSTVGPEKVYEASKQARKMGAERCSLDVFHTLLVEELNPTPKP